MDVLKIVLIVFSSLTIYITYLYNKLIRSKTNALSAWADVEAELTRRFDLIPNLISTVKQYANFEMSIFTQLASARSSFLSPTPTEEKLTLEKQTAVTLNNILLLAENYPQLKASNNFLELQESLTLTEDRIAASRRYYNNRVRVLNSSIIVFPANLIASTLKLKPLLFFDEDLDQPTQGVK